jgi:hypothetical protein
MHSYQTTTNSTKMETNTPKTTKTPSSKTNPTPHNPSQTPTEVRCVTQSQDPERLFETPDSAPDHQHILTSLCDAEHADNTPRFDTPQTKLAPTPVIDSPVQAIEKRDVAEKLFSSHSKAKRKSTFGRTNGAVKVSKKRPYVNPENALLWFLREDFVNANALELDSKFLSTAQLYKPVRDFWSKKTNASKRRNVYAPFEDMKESFIGGWPLSIHYRRLLLKDFMLLNPDDEVVCFMSKQHPFFKSSSWKKNIKEAMLSKAYEPLVLKGLVFFGFEMKVRRNIYRSDIVNGIFSKRDLKKNCTKAGGHGLTMELLGNHHEQLITFDNFISNHSSMLLYSRSLPSRVSHNRKVINNVADTKRIGPTASRLLDEVFGDKEQSTSVLHIHDTKLKTNLRAAEDKVMKQSDISTKRIIQTFTLENNNAAFIKVRDEVDKVMSESVLSIYGNFSELTTPILTQVCS